MATRLYSVPPAGQLEQVTEAVGSAVVTSAVELTVDLGSGVVVDDGSTRKVSKAEVLQGLEVLKEYITKSNWPPA